jgi:hypothetical protein
MVGIMIWSPFLVRNIQSFAVKYDAGCRLSISVLYWVEEVILSLLRIFITN